MLLVVEERVWSLRSSLNIGSLQAYVTCLLQCAFLKLIHLIASAKFGSTITRGKSELRVMNRACSTTSRNNFKFTR